MRQGHGTYKDIGGNTYIGPWKDDQMHGFGEMEMSDGQKIRGRWIRGVLQGKGVI